MNKEQERNLAIKRIFLNLLILLLIFFVNLPSYGYSKESEEIGEYDQKIKDLHISNTDGGDLRWELKAEEALMHNKGRSASLTGVTLNYFFKTGQEIFVRGDKADVDFPMNLISIRGSIRAEATQGLSLETESLIWNGIKKSISTHERIVIKRHHIVLYGQGLEADLELEKIKILSDAKTVIF